MRNFFDITVIHNGGDIERLAKMSRLVNIEKYDPNKEYECDIFFRNSVWGITPKNIKYKRAIEMRHADYKALADLNKLWGQYNDMGIKEVVACGNYVGEMSNIVMHDNPKVIKNILLPNQKTKKILKLVSCTRIDAEKGWNRMLKMMDMMKKAGIKFEWKIFTNSFQYCPYEEVHFYKQRWDIWDYLADADYTVLLSDREGLPYTVQESLQYKTPAIVTDIGGCTEMIKDGVNGYVVPLDMNFDITKILNIPKCEDYDNHALEDWLEYLGYEGEINKLDLIEKFEKEMKEMEEVKVRATKKFYDTECDNVLRNAQNGTIPASEWICSKERADYLVNNNAVQIIEYIKKGTPKDEEKIVPLKEKNLEEVAEKIIDNVKKTVKKKTSKKK